MHWFILFIWYKIKYVCTPWYEQSHTPLSYSDYYLTNVYLHFPDHFCAFNSEWALKQDSLVKETFYFVSGQKFFIIIFWYFSRRQQRCKPYTSFSMLRLIVKRVYFKETFLSIFLIFKLIFKYNIFGLR